MRRDTTSGASSSATVRWKAVRAAKVDFVATDQYEAFSATR